jgi:hypothetical protein
MATLARTWPRFTRNHQVLLYLLAIAVGAGRRRIVSGETFVQGEPERY